MATKLPYQTFEEWKDYGLSRGYDERNPKSLEKSEIAEERTWYNKGNRSKWTKSFNFNRLNLPYQTFEEWRDYGLEKGYNKLNPSRIRNGRDKEGKSWYGKGRNEHWVKLFDFNRIDKSPYQTFEEWKKYGLENDFDKKNISSIRKSKNKDERAWATKGFSESWTGNFPFDSQRNTSPYKTFEEWKEIGLIRNYNLKSSTKLEKSDNEDERSWFNRGRNKKWLGGFDFKLKVKKYEDFEQWKQEGIENNFCERNPSSLEKSQDNAERRWYKTGVRKHWIKDFPLKRKIEFTNWGDFEEWKIVGLEKGFDKRNPYSFQTNGNKDEQSWYLKGVREGWINDFPLKRLRPIPKIKSPEKLKKFLESDENAKLIASLSQVTESTSDLADILIEMYPNKFPSASALAKSLPSAFKKIGSALYPFTMEKAREYYIQTNGLPKNVQIKLGNILENILFNHYLNEFNNKPDEVINELKQYSNGKDEFNNLAQKVLNEYENIFEFEIPGQGSLKEEL